MAIIDLGKVSITWRGAYDGSTAYTPKDAVVYNNASYICIANTTGNLPTDTTYWNVMAAKGVDGTDIGTTLTTQGDLLYRDGSGLQRLAAGTSGQYLKTQGTGANPTWSTISSDCVKLASATTSSSHSTIDIYGYYDDSVYQHYKLVAKYRVDNQSAQIRMAFLTNSASTAHEGGYYMTMHSGYGQSGSDGQQSRKQWNATTLSDMDGTWNRNHTSTEFDTIEGDIFNTQSTTFGKQFRYRLGMFSSNNVIVAADGVVQNNTTTACNGIRLLLSSNNFAHSEWALYGFKK